MVKVLDLDNLPKHYILFDGKKYEFKELDIDDDVKTVNKLKEIQVEKDEGNMISLIHEYVDMVIDLPEDILVNINVNHFALIVEYMKRLPLYEKGFSDKEIDLIEKANALKEAMSIIDIVD